MDVESYELLKARYVKALEKIWDGAAILASNGLCDRPGFHSENIFDTEDGYRLIVSRDALAKHGILIHISGSFVNKTFLTREKSMKIIFQVFQKISGFEGTLESIWRKDVINGVVHFIILPLEGNNRIIDEA